MIDLRKLKTLKKLIVETTKDLDTSMKYFLDNLGTNPEIYDHSKNTRDKTLSMMIRTVVQKAFKNQDISIQNKKLYLIKNYHFIHGSLNVNNHMMMILYFKDIETGLCLIQIGREQIYCRLATTSENENDFFRLPPNQNYN